MAPKSDKVTPLHDASAQTDPSTPPAFVFGSSYARVTPDIPIHVSASKLKAEDTVVDGIDLSGKPKIIFLAGRGKTGKTTAIRWMSERALAVGRPLLMGDVDPGNISFGTYFEGVHEPPDRDSPLIAFKWLEEFVGHAIEHRQTAVIDLGGGDTTLRRLADELPDLAKLADESGVAIVVLYFIGPQLEDLAPMAAMARRAFRPQASAIVMNEAAVDLGLTREQAFGPVSRHALITDALRGGAVPVWMPRLLVADKIELLRVHFMQARDGARGSDGTALLGPFDRSRLRSWLEAMDRQFAGIRTWLP